MPNIKQQEKRMRLATRQRLCNRQVKSSLKTLFKGYEARIAEGDREGATEMLRSLNKQVDQAVAKGVLHKNAGARRKSQAAQSLSKLG